MTCVSMAGALAAIDMQNFARDERCRFQVEDRADNVGDLAHMSDGVKEPERLIGFRGMHGSLADAGCHGVYPDPALGILYGQGLGRGVEPPLVSDASSAGTSDSACSARVVVIWTIWPLPRFSISATAS